MLAVDELGLENADRKILETIIKNLVGASWYSSTGRICRRRRKYYFRSLRTLFITTRFY